MGLRCRGVGLVRLLDWGRWRWHGGMWLGVVGFKVGLDVVVGGTEPVDVHCSSAERKVGSRFCKIRVPWEFYKA